eukprot:CAMPEP_0181377788 /NCGR_PEP_ID=MMETSP1106-20121128/18089_1 /TAXON_ID=81844 /ORGANISM="Mantoniella antarctica, Strain SL-175" /LENGTH=232 /DNA_ID=CAMNT_0023496557 /DNA_START=542 /DNA_END=1237 /DNA_ORIENTATION=+
MFGIVTTRTVAALSARVAHMFGIVTTRTVAALSARVAKLEGLSDSVAILEHLVHTSNEKAIALHKEVTSLRDQVAELEAPPPIQGLPGPPGAVGAAGERGEQGVQGAQGVPNSSYATDNLNVRVLRERCPALREIWPPEGNASSWEGVTVGDLGDKGTRRVVNLNLSGKMRGAVEVPEELWALTALTSLLLESSQLTDLPAEIGALTGLTRLSLNSNQLTNLPAEIGGLTAL